MSRGDGFPASDRDLPDGVRLVARLGPYGGKAGRIAWSPDGRFIAAPTFPREIVFWDAASGERVRSLGGHTNQARALEFDPSRRWLASMNRAGKLFVWDLDGGTLKHAVPVRGGREFAFAAGGRLFVVTAKPSSALLWDVHAECERTDELSARLIDATSFCFDAGGELLAAGGPDGSIRVWDVASGGLVAALDDHKQAVRNVAFHPGGILASSSDDYAIKLWEVSAGRLLRTLEGHVATIDRLSFVADGRVLASSSAGSVSLWDVATGRPLAPLLGYVSCLGSPDAASDPSVARLACTASRGYLSPEHAIDIVELDAETLLRRPRPGSVTYTSAKVVLVGEPEVGKSALGSALAGPDSPKHASKRNEQFWLLDRLGTVRSDGARCEAVLWDLARQPDYRLIHALYLDDADLVLLVFDPLRDDDPLYGMRHWLSQLDLRPGDRRTPAAAQRAILVAARTDRGTPRLSAKEIEQFRVEHGIYASVKTSARTGDGLDRCYTKMRAALAWDRRPTTVTTTTFKQIKDHVLELKERAAVDGVVLTIGAMRERLERDGVAAGFSDDELGSAIKHVANHGYVTRLRTLQGEPLILLKPELLNDVASSIVREARGDPQGVGALDEERLLAGRSDVSPPEPLSPADRHVLLDAAIAIFVNRHVCFRATDPYSLRVYLVFPQLINLKKSSADDAQPIEETVAYAVRGAIDNIYASLVVLLGYSDRFTHAHLWRDQARYVVGDGMICGFKLDDRRDGELEFVLYFGTDVGTQVRQVFQNLFESFLMRRDVTVRRYEPALCPEGHRFNRATVREMAADRPVETFCYQCGRPTTIPAIDTLSSLTTRASAGVRVERVEVELRASFETALSRLNAYVSQGGLTAPSCFVSYAWGVPEHARWIEERLASDLRKAGIEVVLDRWAVRTGTHLARFAERIQECDRVLVVGTTLYREKYDSRATPDDDDAERAYVALEGDLIANRALEKEGTVLPVLLEGTERDAFPPHLVGRRYADFRQPTSYFPSLLELVLDLYEIPPRDPIHRELRRLVELTPGEPLAGDW